jgi:hypothetical protein
MEPRSTNEGFDPFNSADAFLGKSGLTAEAFAAEVREYALAPDFPTADCLSPTDVSGYSRTGILSDQQNGHVETCVYCGSLLKTLVPDQAELRMFRAEVLEARKKLAESSASIRPRSRWKFVPANPNRWHVGMLVAACALFVVFLGSHYHRSTPSVVQMADVKRQLPNHPIGPITPEPTANLLVTSENQASNKMVVKVGMDQHRLKPSSFPEAAAGVATVSLARASFGSSAAHQSELREKYSEGLAELSSQIVSAHLPANADDPSVAWASYKKGQEATAVSCVSISKELAARGLEVVRGKSDSDCVVKFLTASLKINPSESVDKTIYFVNVLRTNNGDVTALNNAVKNVDVQWANTPNAAALTQDIPKSNVPKY